MAMDRVSEKKRPKYNLWQNSSYMIREAWHVRKSVLGLCLAFAVVAVAGSLAELYIAPVILKKVEVKAPLPELCAVIGGFVLILMLFAALKVYVSKNTLFGRIEVRTSILQKINRKVSVTSFPNMEDTSVLTLLEKCNKALSSNDEAVEGIWTTLTELLKNIFGFVIYLGVLSPLHPLLVLAVIAAAAASYFVTKHINGWEYAHKEEEARLAKKIAYVFNKSEDRALAKDIRLFGMRQWLEDVCGSTLRLYDAFIFRREKTYLWADMADVALTLLRNGIAYFYLILMVISEGLPASDFLLYFTAVSGFTAWVTGILSGFTTLNRQSMEIATVREFLEMPEQFKFEDGEPLNAREGETYEIQLKNVNFRYPEADKDILHNLNLTIKAGEKLAVVGLNGAGKTTLVRLICGFYDPTEGEVLLNGEDIRKYNRFDYYRLFSAVFQQLSLLPVSVAENVAQTSDGVDMARVRSCIRKAGLTEKIESLPKQYETPVGRQVFEDGAEFSGGQVQRLMLARALYKNAPVIVLDEPTAALDPIAENDIYMKYNEMTGGRTSVFISHRLASTRFCDRILFIADGHIAEEGTHDSLMAKGGQYAELFHVQSKYYQEGGDPDVA